MEAFPQPTMVGQLKKRLGGITIQNKIQTEQNLSKPHGYLSTVNTQTPAALASVTYSNHLKSSDIHIPRITLFLLEHGEPIHIPKLEPYPHMINVTVLAMRISQEPPWTMPWSEKRG